MRIGLALFGPEASDASRACVAAPPAMFDTAPTLSSAVCPASRSDCLVCPQCTDGAGHATVEYVLTDYPRSCGCPYPADGADMNCHRDAGVPKR